MRNIGLDLSAKKISFCEVRDGQVVDRATVRKLEDLLDRLGPNTPKAQVVFEACREAWRIHAQLTAWGHEAVMVDTTRVKHLGIGQHGRKTDRIDAEVLAHAAEHGRIPRAHVLSPDRQRLRIHLGVRRSLVESRANLATTIRGILRAEGIRFAACPVERLLDKLEQSPMPEQVRGLLAPMLTVIKTLNLQIVATEAQLRGLCEREPVITVLATMPGVGLIVAAAFVSVIDQAQRFRHAHQVEAYLGLVPSQKDSGERKARLGAITKQGNSYLRALLIQAAWSVVRSRDTDDPLKRWSDAIVQRRGKRIAVVAVARRIVGILWAMWRDGTVYDPQSLGHEQAQGLKRQAQNTLVRAQAMRTAAMKLQAPKARRTSSPSTLEVAVT
jgi:transposase